MHMKISQEVQYFIEKNISLIEQDTKASWEEVYNKIYDPDYEMSCEDIGAFGDLMLDMELDPLSNLDYVPPYFLFESKRTSINIPEGIETISTGAFSGSSIKSIVIPRTCKTIEERAFYECFKLSKISIPNNVEEIMESAFASTGIDIIQLPKKLVDIAPELLYNTDVEELTIPVSVQSIGYHAFSLTILDTLIYESTKAQWENIHKEPEWDVLFEGSDEHPRVKQVICTDGVIDL